MEAAALSPKNCSLPQKFHCPQNCGWLCGYMSGALAVYAFVFAHYKYNESVSIIIVLF